MKVRFASPVLSFRSVRRLNILLRTLALGTTKFFVCNWDSDCRTGRSSRLWVRLLRSLPRLKTKIELPAYFN